MFPYSSSKWYFAKDIEPKNGYGIDSTSGYPIATVKPFESISKEEMKGNASLIKHAPDMFEKINETLKEMEENGLESSNMYKKLSALVNEIEDTYLWFV